MATTATAAELLTLMPAFHAGRARVISVDIKARMQASRVTIADLARHMNVTQKRVREVRSLRILPFLVGVDYVEAIEQVAAAKKGGVR